MLKQWAMNYLWDFNKYPCHLVTKIAQCHGPSCHQWPYTITLEISQPHHYCSWRSQMSCLEKATWTAVLVHGPMAYPSLLTMAVKIPINHDLCKWKACMHVCIWKKNIHMYMYIFIHDGMHACMSVGMYACMHVCKHACLYVSMHLCMYVCMHVCMYACMHV